MTRNFRDSGTGREKIGLLLHRSSSGSGSFSRCSGSPSANLGFV